MVKKNEFVNEIKERTADFGFTTKEVDAMLKAVSDIILDTMARGDSVKLGEVATFSGVETSARVGHNPQTGGTVQIPAKTGVPKCKFSTVAKKNATAI